MAKKPKVLPSVEWLEPRVKAMRVVSLLSFFALGGLLAAYYLVFADLHGARPWVILLVELIPWIVLAPAMIIGSVWMIQPVQRLLLFRSTASPYHPEAASMKKARAHTHEMT